MAASFEEANPKHYGCTQSSKRMCLLCELFRTEIMYGFLLSGRVIRGREVKAGLNPLNPNGVVVGSKPEVDSEVLVA